MRPAKGFGLFERRSNAFFHFVEEGGLESVVQKGIIEMFHIAPERVIREAALGNKAMDVRIPLKEGSV